MKMWTNTSAAIKCPRGDCLHTKCAADEPPCLHCTCNQWSEMPGRTFRFTPKGLPEIKKMEEKNDDRTT